MGGARAGGGRAAAEQIPAGKEPVPVCYITEKKGEPERSRPQTVSNGKKREPRKKRKIGRKAERPAIHGRGQIAAKKNIAKKRLGGKGGKKKVGVAGGSPLGERGG